MDDRTDPPDLSNIEQDPETEDERDSSPFLNDSDLEYDDSVDENNFTEDNNTTQWKINHRKGQGRLDGKMPSSR